MFASSRSCALVMLVDGISFQRHELLLVCAIWSKWERQKVERERRLAGKSKNNLRIYKRLAYWFPTC